MSRLKKIIQEAHRRSLWQVLAIYVAASWVIFQVVQTLTEGLGLPGWFPALALVLLMVGLPVVLGTAFVQEGGPALRKVDPTLLPDSGEIGLEPLRAETEAGGIGRLLTWRNAIAGGVLAFALWGVVAASWLMLGAPGLFIVKAEAADFFTERDHIVVADLQNDTDQEALGLAIREAIITDLDQSEYVNAVTRADMGEVLERMRLADTASITEEIAVEIARREGYPAVVSGTVAPLGAGYQLTARIIETSTGDVAVRLRETADDATEVVGAVERLSHLVRRHLGESIQSVRRSKSLPVVTTASLEALELYARGREVMHGGDPAASIPFFNQAIERDTAFASAYRALGVAYGNIGNLAAGQTNVDAALRHADRLIDRERFLTSAAYHSYRNQFDSAAHYYRLIIERDPENHTSFNNLGDAYERMGRYEEALDAYRRTVEMKADIAYGHFNLASAARTLGRQAEADSALAQLKERFPATPFTRWTAFANAYYADEFEAADSLAARITQDPSPSNAAWGVAAHQAVAALHGKIDRAFASAARSVELAFEANATLQAYVSLRTTEYTALAAGRPERARPYLERVHQLALDETGTFSRHLALGIVANGYVLGGDLEQARSILADMDSLVERGDFRPAGMAEQTRAVIALQENRLEESVEHLRRARAADYGVLFPSGRLLLADAYAAMGRLGEAAVHYDSLTISHRLNFLEAMTYGAVRPLGHERAGNVYLALGDTASAVKHLAAFTDLWQNADPELQSRVESARRLMAQLAGERK